MTREMAIQILGCYGSNYCWENGESIPAEAVKEAIGMAFAALRAQEPVEPYMDFDGLDVWRCGNCHRNIFHPRFAEDDEGEKNYRKFCYHCGRAVKWND